MEFREIVRKKQALGKEECIAILKKEVRGVLSVYGLEGYPYGMPINHYYDEESGCIYFHGGKTGHKIEALKKDAHVSFCVYDEGYRREGEWALNIKSVIVFGRIEFVESTEETEKISRALCYKFTDNEEYIRHEIEKSLKGTLCFRLVPDHISGKIVNEA